MKLILDVQGRYSTKIKMQLVINDKTISFNKYKMNFLGYVSEAWQPQQRNTQFIIEAVCFKNTDIRS